MRISKKVREQMLKLCGSICDDDGLDARMFRTTKTERSRSDQTKCRRLCQQVARTLNLLLPESADERVGELNVVSVVPGETLSVLTVEIAVPPGMDRDSRVVLLESLRQQEGWLRFEIAARISRKRVPRLVFEFVAANTEGKINDG